MVLAKLVFLGEFAEGQGKSSLKGEGLPRGKRNPRRETGKPVQISAILPSIFWRTSHGVACAMADNSDDDDTVAAADVHSLTLSLIC